MKDFVRVSRVPPAISMFLSVARIATVCFTDNGAPHCINCFFAFDPDSNCLIFKSRRGTGHDRFVFEGARVAGTILPDVLKISSLKGLQFKGETMAEKDVAEMDLKRTYSRRFPFTKLLPGYCWAVKLHYMKFSDNSKGFGNKTLWLAGTEEVTH